MKRDMDYIRNLLIEIEETDSIPKSESQSSDDIRRLIFHLLLMREANLVGGFEVRELNEDVCHIEPKTRPRLTWYGHEFLDAARNESIWRSARKRIGDAVGSASFAVLTQVLAEITSQQLGFRS